MRAIENDATDVGAPPGIPPTAGNDPDKQVRHEQGRPQFDFSPMLATRDAQSWAIGFKTAQLQEMLCRPLLLRRDLRAGPVAHELHRLEAMAIASTGAWIVGTDRLA